MTAYFAVDEKSPLLLEYIKKNKYAVYINREIKGFGVRHVQVLLMFCGMCCSYFLRVNMSSAIVPMTQAATSLNETTFDDWDHAIKGLILSSFFWGYVVAQLPASLLAKRYGGKLVLASGTFVASIVTALHPLATKTGGWRTLVGLRIVVGLTQGVVYPCTHTLLSHWVPQTERSFLAASVYSGAQFGTALLLSTSGDIFNSSLGWPGIFYISGAIALAWSLIFFAFGCDGPEKSNMISKTERKYIENQTGKGEVENMNMSVPWKSLFTSLPFYGLIAAHCGFTWGFYTMLTEIPTYLNSVLQLNVKSNALLSALPYFVMGVVGLVVSPFSDWLINHNYLSVTASRKLFNSIGQWIPMICLIGLGYTSPVNKGLAITLLTIGVGFNAASFCGYLVNHMDLSPNFAGPMMGLTNCISNLLSLCAPLVVGAIVIHEENVYEWRIVFFITAAVYFVCNTIFIFFGSAIIQSWNYQVSSNNTIPIRTGSGDLEVTQTPNDELKL